MLAMFVLINWIIQSIYARIIMLITFLGKPFEKPLQINLNISQINQTPLPCII